MERRWGACEVRTKESGTQKTTFFLVPCGGSIKGDRTPDTFNDVKATGKPSREFLRYYDERSNKKRPQDKLITEGPLKDWYARPIEPMEDTQGRGREDLFDKCIEEARQQGGRWRDSQNPYFLPVEEKLAAEALPDSVRYYTPAEFWGTAVQPSLAKPKRHHDYRFDPAGVRQSLLGTCWFDAAAAAAAMLGFLHFDDKLGIIAQADEEHGVYQFRFIFELDRVCLICVDELIPGIVFQGNLTHLGTYSKTEGELWPILLLKAYAKLWGDTGYYDICGGTAANGLRHLTGGSAVCLCSGNGHNRNKFNTPVEIATLFQQLAPTEVLMCFHWIHLGPPETTLRTDGLYNGHAYTVMPMKGIIDDTQTTNTLYGATKWTFIKMVPDEQGYAHYFIKICNPHGRNKAPWSGGRLCGTHFWKTGFGRRVAASTQFTPSPRNPDDVDGCIVMEVEDVGRLIHI
eukprot:NODE_41_length_2085_cov_435.688968_g40_i0.p1 GENE.NODE_41_length_2085_cov_435.688968_g40_i0~~NODE_41_length_2085_cov_435.688968_g40_i0.p1  ORF type:complete len:458 (-),score=60.87 NODE_41_length_2085_cov_435.688968_g40_i0:640-2013(-)